MAFLGDNNDKLLDGDQGQGASSGSSGGAVVNTGGGAISTGSPISTAGVSAGGAGGWTNIQAYLNANKGNTSSAGLLKDTADKTFDPETEKLTQTSQEAKSKAQGEVEKVAVSKDQASRMIDDASSSGKGSDVYNQNTGKLKNVLSAQYSGPTGYDYALGADTQNLGSGLQAQDQRPMMTDLYNKTTGGLSRGQSALQTQLDLDEPAANAISSAKNAALAKYAGLTDNLATTAKGTQADIANAQKQFQDYKAGINQQLSESSSADQRALNDLASKWNQEEATSYSQNPFANMNQSWIQGLSSTKAIGPQNWKTMFGVDAANYGTKAVNGGTASAENVAGGDAYRNRWNAIRDILGGGGEITPSGAAPVHSKWTFDKAGYEAAVNAAYEAARAKSAASRPDLYVNKAKGDVLASNPTSGLVGY